MSTPRLANIPFEHVESELAAFPLASEASFLLGAASERLTYLRAEIARLGHLVFERSLSPEDVNDLVKSLHNEQDLRQQGFPDRPFRSIFMRSQPEQNDGPNILRDYLRSEKIWRRGRAPEVIDIGRIRHERAALLQLQDGLRRKIGKRCLAVEVNPSSNLLVGDLGNFAGHPLWRLRPISQDADTSPLCVTVGSDDPLTFATTLPHEYQLLFDTLILMGHSHEVAMRWIDTARDSGMLCRFTLAPNLPEIARGLKVPNLLAWQRPEGPP